MIKDFKTYIGEGTLWGNTIMRSDTGRVRKEDEITEDYVRSFLKKDCKRYCERIEIVKDSTGKKIVNIIGSFYFREDITEIPFQFGEVTGEFVLEDCEKITSLEGSPEKCDSFFCIDCPELKSLEYAPKEITGTFNCDGCVKLTSLKGCPEKCNIFSCCGCSNLKTLIYCPKKVKINFICFNCGCKFTKEDVDKYCDVKNILV